MTALSLPSSPVPLATQVKSRPPHIWWLSTVSNNLNTLITWAKASESPVKAISVPHSVLLFFSTENIVIADFFFPPTEWFAPVSNVTSLMVGDGERRHAGLLTASSTGLLASHLPWQLTVPQCHTNVNTEQFTFILSNQFYQNNMDQIFQGWIKWHQSVSDICWINFS